MTTVWCFSHFSLHCCSICLYKTLRF